ncbi:PREDICTED: uncharacterized protein LOC109129511 [Camelina sativa]|uniref:Uncharacterized protein LOC109129511 n=1 Tax=Camelina sativa TaxID=90675 RepID=A0ABM1R2T0_CAMSA|nr:PREDICTED: uncharacterized protein LOC109129511 [Camelina sativa]
MTDVNMNANGSFEVPVNLCQEATMVSQFSLLVRPANSRRQNLRAMIRFFPRLWGMDNSVIGRVVEHGRSQFMFPSYEALQLVYRRGRWSFNEWMVAMESWQPNLPDANPLFINFWIQIRGIPLQFFTPPMARYIAETLGLIVDSEIDDIAGGNVEFARVYIQWPLDQPVLFQRRFRFGNDWATISFPDIHNPPPAPNAMVQAADIPFLNLPNLLAMPAPPANIHLEHQEHLPLPPPQHQQVTMSELVPINGHLITIGDLRSLYHNYTATPDPAEAEARRRGLILALEHTSNRILEAVIRPVPLLKSTQRKRRRVYSLMDASLSGGLASFWKSLVDVSILYQDARLVDCYINDKISSFYLSCIYGHPYPQYRPELWERLQRYAVNRDEAWIMIGDFNQIMSNSEKLGGHDRDENTFRDFRDMLTICDMIDLKHTCNKFSWSGQRSIVRDGVRTKELIQCCLDRALTNTEWFATFSASMSTFIEPIESDHRPVIIDLQSDTRVKKGLFRYDHRLVERAGFLQAMKEDWNRLSSLRSFSDKLKFLRTNISKWKQSNVTNSAEEIQML